MTMSELPTDAVLNWWFGAPGTPEAAEFRDMWFRKDAEADAEIARLFGDAVAAAGAGAFDAAASGSADAALATVLLLDQFPRNVFRGTPDAWRYDPQALALARASVGSGRDMAVPPIRRLFFYLPFEHAESVAAQEDAVRLIEALPPEAEWRDRAVDSAHRHLEIVRRFGRFPHRNAVLGRETTAEEAAFLLEPGSSF